MSLFSKTLISNELQSTLPKGFILRPLEPSDYEKGFLEVLGQLTVVGNVDKDTFMDQFYYMKNRNNEYFTIVIEDTQRRRVVAAGTVLVERKFVHMIGKVGHIEDIVVNKEYRGQNFGKWIIEQLKHIGKQVGCYKIILDCSEKNVPFYEKCGFTKKEVEMAWYIPENDPTEKLKAKI
ncbi:acyl-CoA N-acyltransferase [Rozella allomycis CSF55]|uniref:Glucosamine 6-phosphate N-acetyltransferase n=1 Tax=Rozella allomycis (strain CSF55) TaxID=988480 RepID=A0A4P9YES2_ROZAC|nr:acyl-CoA N-acyltransferase [Rozella allomycis CSF55]